MAHKADEIHSAIKCLTVLILMMAPVLAYAAPSDDYLAEALEDSVSTGGGNNANGVAITATQLSGIDGITGVVTANEPGYQNAIALEVGFSNPRRWQCM